MALLAGTSPLFVTKAPSSHSCSHVKGCCVYGGTKVLPSYNKFLNASQWTGIPSWCWRGRVVKESRVGSRSLCVACLPSPSSSSEEIDPTNLFVSGLSFFTTEEGFRNAFSRFGQLVEAKIIMDKFAQRSKGFGFVRYASKEEAEEAIKGMDGKFLDGRVIFVEVAKPRPKYSGPPRRATGPPGLR